MKKFSFFKKTLIMNVQADQPFINPAIVKSIYENLGNLKK